MRLIRSKLLILLTMLFVMMGSFGVLASSEDNSLAGLGITTEGAVVTPEFVYNTWEYDVVVPAGTTELTLDPTPSSGYASITDISGTTLAEDGTATVFVTVTAGNGNPFTYTLHVTREAAAPETEAQTEAQTQPATETEAQTEDSQYVRVDKNTIQEAENTITSLKEEIVSYRETISRYTQIIYGLIAAAVVLLFLSVNLIFRNRSLKARLRGGDDGDYEDFYEDTPAPKSSKQAQSASQPKKQNQGKKSQAAPQQRVKVEKVERTPEAEERVKQARKQRVMPEYEKEKPAPKQISETEAPETEKTAAKTKSKKDIKVDMIDL